MNQYLSKELIVAARKENNWMAGHVRTLHNFGVCGMVEDTHLMPILKTFLTANKIPFESNNRMLLWLPDIKKSLRDLFKQK